MKPKAGYNHALYRANYDDVFKKKKTSSDWAKDDEFCHIKVIDPKGWNDLDDFNYKKITKEDFIFKLAKSSFVENK